MTTITADAVSQGRASQFKKSVITFVAGAVLAGGLATGVSMARDDSSSPSVSSPKTVSVSNVSSADLECQRHRTGPC